MAFTAATCKLQNVKPISSPLRRGYMDMILTITGATDPKSTATCNTFATPSSHAFLPFRGHLAAGGEA